MLELGSGTGRVTLPLAESGIEIVGLELSEAMRAFAQAKLAAADEGVRERAEFVAGNTAAFDLGRTFALVIVPFRAFQMLHTREEQQSCLAATKRHLQPRGTLAINLYDPWLDTIAPGWKPEDDEHDLFAEMVIEYPATGNIVEIDTIFREVDGNAETVREERETLAAVASSEANRDLGEAVTAPARHGPAHRLNPDAGEEERVAGSRRQRRASGPGSATANLHRDAVALAACAKGHAPVRSTAAVCRAHQHCDRGGEPAAIPPPGDTLLARHLDRELAHEHGRLGEHLAELATRERWLDEPALDPRRGVKVIDKPFEVAERPPHQPGQLAVEGDAPALRHTQIERHVQRR